MSELAKIGWISKLKKIVALAESGIGGERENACSLLVKLMEKYKVSWEDLEDAPKRSFRHFHYKSKFERILLFQCIFRGTCSNRIKYSQLSRGVICVELSFLNFVKFLLFMSILNHF